MRNIIIALSGVISVLVILMALLIEAKRANMELEMAAIQSKSDSYMMKLCIEIYKI